MPVPAVAPGVLRPENAESPDGIGVPIGGTDRTL